MEYRLTKERKPSKEASAPSPIATPWQTLPLHATVVVDTAPFIYVFESHPEFADKFTGVFEAAADGKLSIALSTITLAEVLTGPLRAGQAALARRYEKVLSGFTIVPVTASIASSAAQLRAQYRLKLPDAIQLATALETGATALVTHDRDFSRVTGLPILTGAR
jgi:predicted nucleic acid-binding protein